MSTTPGNLVPLVAPHDEYVLPYPGMLPDNPFYFIKTIRDTVVLFLITDPSKKADFNLLQASKRFQAGVFLMKKNHAKAPLAFSTLSKGIQYFSHAIAITLELKKERADVSYLTTQLSQSLVQYKSMLADLSTSFPQDKIQIKELQDTLLPFDHQLFLLSK